MGEGAENKNVSKEQLEGVDKQGRERLKNWYKCLIEGQEHVRAWRNEYENICKRVSDLMKGVEQKSPAAKVEQIAQKLREDAKKVCGYLDNDKNRTREIKHCLRDEALKDSLLIDLIWSSDNGVTKLRQSVLSGKDFRNLIENGDVLSALSNLIVNPTEDSFSQFTTAWQKTKPASMSWIRINRVAAACTREVSTTVKMEDVNVVYTWLIGNDLVDANMFRSDPKISYKEAFENLQNDKQASWFKKNQLLLEYLNACLVKVDKQDNISSDLYEPDPYYCSIFVRKLFEYITNPFTIKKQIIKYGAPGTGKTYQARQQTRLRFNIWKDEYAPGSKFTYESQSKIVQFHPSFSYEDFIEGLRPDGKGGLTLQNGIFKEFCRKAGQWEIDVYNLWRALVEEEKLAEDWEKQWEKLTVKNLVDCLANHIGPSQNGLGGEKTNSPEEQKKITGVRCRPIYNASAIKGVDGLKKTLENELFKRFTSDDWSYFLKYDDGWKTDLDDNVLISEVIPPFFFIIDEVNRAELSRVFGELMYCLEYRGIEGCVTTQYANLNNENTGMIEIGGENQFFIPSNVYIIGTMNNIDRSVESFDFALRRRFRWEEVEPDESVLRYHLRQLNDGKWTDLATNLERLNEAIEKEPLLGADYRIGHAYLMNLKYNKDLKLADVRESVWEDSIKPLLQEYLRGTGKADKIDELWKAFKGTEEVEVKK